MGDMTPEKRLELKVLIERLKTLGTEELMSYWINSKIKEAEMYNALANSVSYYSWDKRIENLLRELARESLNNAETFMRKYREKYRKALTDVAIESLEIEFSQRDLEENLRNGRLEDVLRVLIEGKEFARTVYEYLAEQSEDDLKELFIQLARVEEEHYRRLENLLNALESR